MPSRSSSAGSRTRSAKSCSSTSPTTATCQDRLLQAFFAALEACHRLEQEFAGRLRFDAGRCDVAVNDRLLAPNTSESWAAIEPDLRFFFDGLLGRESYRLEHRGEPRERLRAAVESTAFVAVSCLLEDVAS